MKTICSFRDLEPYGINPLTGEAFAGPAALQAPPSNVLPSLDLEVDDEGNIWIKPPNWTPSGNGVVGYGRFLT